jgi:inhibitor of KinA sporulation pathway (predicted exonuclease)
VNTEVFTFIDLELNQPSGSIIQIGVCIANIKTKEILERVSILVNPFEAISPFITELTGLTQKQIDDDGIPLNEAYAKLVNLHHKYKSFRNFVQWGQGDAECIKKQMNLDDDSFVGGRRSIDVKTVFIAWRLSQSEKIQSGLAKSLLKLGEKFEGTKHNAESDAYNTYRIFMLLLKKFSK